MADSLQVELQRFASFIPWSDPRPLEIRQESRWLKEHRPLAPPLGLTVLDSGKVVVGIQQGLPPKTRMRILRHELWHAYAYAHWGIAYCRRWDEAAAEWWAVRGGSSYQGYADSARIWALGLENSPSHASQNWSWFFLSLPDSVAWHSLATCAMPDSTLSRSILDKGRKD